MSFAAGFLGGLANGMNDKRDREHRNRAISIMDAADTSGVGRNDVAFGGVNDVQRGDAMEGAGLARDGGSAGQGLGSGKVGFNNWMTNPELAKGIMETADELGMEPEDLATIISYETAGTFDPTKRGPRTQWGQHRGLIQFGEPQAKQHGVNWDDPITSQLGRDGAVARYYKASGWKPGMSFLDAYSVVNAGGPGRGNRSDANNGGAPGTVADKVNSQMAGHRAKARAMLERFNTQSAAPEPATKATPATAPDQTTWPWARKYMTGGA